MWCFLDGNIPTKGWGLINAWLWTVFMDARLRPRNRVVFKSSHRCEDMAVEQRSLDTGVDLEQSRAGNGEDVETIIAEDDEGREQCPYCNEWYSKIVSHWSHPSVECHHPPITDDKYEVLVGLMMGDGSLHSRNRENQCIKVAMNNVTFLTWFSDRLGWLFGNIAQNKEAGDASFGNKCNYDYWRLWTRSHPAIDFESWWVDRELHFPNREWSKEALRMWYVSDGNMHWNTNPYIEIRSFNEQPRPETVINNFERVGFDASFSSNRIRLKTADTERFFDFVGHEPVPGFEYKWEWKDEDRYHELKDYCHAEHCTKHASVEDVF